VKVFRCSAIVALLCAVASSAQAQTAPDIVARMLAEYERRAEGIDDYTLIQEVMGLETVSYFEREMVDGRPVFRLRRSSAGGMDVPDSGQGGLDEIYSIGAELGERATYRGVERIDDYDLHVLDVSDFSGLGFGRNVTPDSEFAPRGGTIFLDVDTYAPRRLEFEGEMTNAQGVHTVSSTIEMGDYREVEGLLVPFRTVVQIEGLGAAIDPETRAQFERMQRELESMPPEQRAMVESMMAEQLEQFRAMMSGEDAPMTVRILVREVRVNAGPPAR
jgi:hypothetical protein